jgi:heme exporter protein D
MQFDSLAAAWQMAGHGPYVWASYLLCLIVLVALIWAPLARQRRLLRELRAAERRRSAQVSASPPNSQV